MLIVKLKIFLNIFGIMFILTFEFYKQKSIIFDINELSFIRINQILLN